LRSIQRPERRPVSFRSILFPDSSDDIRECAQTGPAFFSDLNFDQIVRGITTEKEAYDLAPFFRSPLGSVDSILFRHEVMRDLERPEILRVMKDFAQRMRALRESLKQTERRYNRQQKMRWFLDTVALYGQAMTRLNTGLVAADCHSRGLRSFGNYLADYTSSPSFTALIAEAFALTEALSAIRFEIRNEGLAVEVRPYDGAADYGAAVAELFGRFDADADADADAGKALTFDFGNSADVDQVESSILRLVANTHSAEFGRLAHYCEANSDFLDPIIVQFDREMQFYIAYLDYIAPLRKSGLVFCYPKISADNKAVRARETFDLALAQKLAGKHERPVCNDFFLQGAERIIVVTGPNQGGKTTFARTFGQLHYLAALGCPVPGAEAKLYLADRIFTHFERAERTTSLNGKLQDDLLRIRKIMDAATPRSVVLINEIFASTTLNDAVALSRRVADRICALDALCVWITFIDEIASLNEKTVSMVSAVSPDQPERRTFKILRQPADGLAYALSLAAKYRLAHDQLVRRITV
jgi:DNA mismatch repair protein MutS